MFNVLFSYNEIKSKILSVFFLCFLCLFIYNFFLYTYVYIFIYIYIIIPTTDKYPSTCAVPLLHECMLLCNYHPNNKCTYHLKKKLSHTHMTHTQKTNNALYLATTKTTTTTTKLLLFFYL